MFRNLIFLSTFILIITITFFACSEDDPVSSDPGKANVMAIHASPDAPGVDVFVDNNLAQQNLTFPNNTPYIEIDAGIRNIKVNVTGIDLTVFNENLPFDANKNYSAFAIDRAINLDALLLVDDLTAPASSKAHVRFLHLSPDAPAVDITLSDGTVIFGNVAFKEYIDFTPLDAGTHSLEVRTAGTTDVVLELGNITLIAGKIYTVFLRGLYQGIGPQALGVSIIENN
ncbi:MAG: DUF4397 domain-containing protein [Ignavibacteriaceae bacterium]|nr:DUF4397 domain-containing protein [Ignavibacteriaceae bacterium]